MRFGHRALTLAALVAFPLLSQAANAQVTHGWTICTPGGFSSCHSVAIGTTPLMTGSVRTGTGITISVTNLQGSGYAFDNTSISGLFQVFFAGKNFSSPMLFSLNNSSTATLTGPGASGSVTWTTETGFNVSNAANYATAYAGGSGLIGGCAGGPLSFGFTTGAQTCGTGASAVFNFTIGTIFDANQMDNVFVESIGANDQFGYCFTDPAAYDPGFPTCETKNEYLVNVTPEPVTIALLGTGLVGIGGAYRRRRKGDAA